MSYETVVYKTIGNINLEMRVFRPEANFVAGTSETAPAPGARPGILWFACGSWNGFDLDKRTPDATYFAARGAVVFATLVRVQPVHGTTPAECVIDAKSAVRWVRAHAKEYGVDPAKLVCSGSSASGHVSSCTALIDDFNDPADDLTMSAKPNAVCVCCPVLVVYHT
ncbi:MAG TPA: alpha/beta hydrolase, partial [Planctomycetota bacterium]|nr:alpha/beta hydrolase [Planctomycetota bacterium]